MTRNFNAIVILLQKIHIERAGSKSSYFMLSWQDIDSLFYARLIDTINVLANLKDTDVFLSVDENETQNLPLNQITKNITLFEHHNMPLVERILASIDYVFEKNYRRLILLLNYDPFYKPEFFEGIFSQLHYDDDCFIYGNSYSGKCCLIGSNTNYSHLFMNMLKSGKTKEQRNNFFNVSQILKDISKDDVIIFTTPNIKVIENDYDIFSLNDIIEKEMTAKTNIADNTYKFIQSLKEKYNRSKPKNEAWDIRRHI